MTREAYNFADDGGEPDRPLDLAPGQDDEQDPTIYRPRRMPPGGEGDLANSETSSDDPAPAPKPRLARMEPAGDAKQIGQPLRWALDSLHEPAMAAADWLARDIDPNQSSACGLLADPKITLAQVRQAKNVFKTMRIVGEKSADRHVGARMYAAAIAAGMVRHNVLVSRQSDAALLRAFQGLLDDARMPKPLRDLAGMAICVLRERRFKAFAARNEPRSQSA